MEKQRPSSFDLAMDMIRASGQLISGRAPKAERMASPGMKKVAKAIGDVAIYGWSSRPKG